MLKLTRNALAAVALASAGVLTLQQPGVASALTLRAFGASVSALGVTLVETQVSTVLSPNNMAVNVTAGSLLSAGTLPHGERVASDDPRPYRARCDHRVVDVWSGGDADPDGVGARCSRCGWSGDARLCRSPWLAARPRPWDE
jgi:hypothetical protein